MSISSPSLTSRVLQPHAAVRPSIFASLICWQTHLLLFVLLFPTKLFNEFYIAASLAIVACCWRTKPGGSRLALMLIGFELYLLTTSVLRSLTFPSAGVPMHDNVRDYYELARLLPPIAIFVFARRWHSLQAEHFVAAFMIFLAIDGVITFLQSNQRDFYGLQELAAQYYNVEHHLDVALKLDGRAPGLSTGPGQHAAILGIAMIVMLNVVFILPRLAAIGVAGICFTSVLLAYAQSQTGLIVISTTVCGLLAFHILKGTHRQRTLAVMLSIALSLSITTLLGLISQFSYLSSLFSLGLTRNSYIVRQETRQYVLGQMSITPQWYVIGHGKEYFGKLSGAMDNEYLYALAVYGLPVFCCFVIVVLSLAMRLLLFTPQVTTNYWGMTLLGIIALGLGFAWPSSFFTEPRSMTILSFVLAALLSQQQSSTLVDRQGNLPVISRSGRSMAAGSIHTARPPFLPQTPHQFQS